MTTKKTDIATACAVRLAIRHPFWTEIFYSMGIEEATPEQVAGGLSTEATDGRTVWINKAFWTGLTLDQQVTEMVHELCHKMFLHPTRRGTRDPRIWNIACDLAVNSLMKQNGFVFDNTWLYDAQYDGWLAEAIYADLMKNGGAKAKKYQLAPGRGDVLAPPPMSPEETEKFETEVQAMVDRAVAAAKAYGKLPLGIEKGLVEAYKPKREAWYNALHRYMQSLRTSEYNWARLNRRTLRSHGCFTPLHQSEALGDIVVAIDASGSVYDAASQSNFAGHINAILGEARPRKVYIYYFDTKMYPGEEIEAGTLDFTSRPKGGGGTAFAPIFEQLDEDGIVPEVCIVLTDLEGSFPNEAPEYPVVWASIEDHEAPFGEVLYLGD
jgi:predicted metal-dependent peptidase